MGDAGLTEFACDTAPMKSFTGDHRVDMAIAVAGGYEPRRPGSRGSTVPTDTGPDWPANRWLMAATVRVDGLSRTLRECIQGAAQSSDVGWRASCYRAIATTAADMQSLLQVIADNARVAAAEEGIFISGPPAADPEGQPPLTD